MTINTSQPIRKNLKDFFGKGYDHMKNKKLSLADIDKAIGKAVSENGLSAKNATERSERDSRKTK